MGGSARWRTRTHAILTCAFCCFFFWAPLGLSCPCREATDLVLLDKSFPTKRFLVLEGEFSKEWPSLAPGASVTTSVVVDARRAGTFYTHPATLTYKPAGGVETVR